MATYLLLTASVIILCVIFNKISSKIGIPVLLAFIIIGMLFGTDGIVKIAFDNFAIAEQICSISLIFIMFYGGFGTKWSAAKPIVKPAILLSSLGVILTAAITGWFCYAVLQIPILESLLIGSVVSSTDAASVFSILRSNRLNLKDNTASLLEVESGSNDPCAYMLTAIILSIMAGNGNSLGSIAYLIFAQIIYGLLFAWLISRAALWALKKYRFADDGFDAIFITGVAILAYAAPTAIAGNGYLSAYIVGLVMGNSEIKNKKSLVIFFNGATGLMQIVIFFLLGLLSFPSKLPEIAFSAFLIALFLTFIARPLSVFAILTPFKSSTAQQILVSWSGLRGAASIVFAVMAVISPAKTSTDIFHIVFFIVLFSILLQGSLIPLFSRKLNMIDDTADVMKTFNDYSDEVPIQFIEFTISPKHPWSGQLISEILLPPDTLIVLLDRGGNKIVPKGNTILQPCDKLILSAKSLSKIDGVSLIEKHLESGHPWLNKQIYEINIKPDTIIIMIQRKEKIIIPNGNTILKENDILVINNI